ncbi:MAG TPA: hypothetical protein DCP53_03975 [Elusimicrobia bacterium]|nr:hypothetical protein [Elusimicrobiota bacterium]
MICTLLYPFDMGLDLDLKKDGTNTFFKVLNHEKASSLIFFDKHYYNVEIETRIYRFGCGLISISFQIDKNLQACTQISSLSSQIKIDGTELTEYCKILANRVIKESQIYSTHNYEKKLEEVEIFPVFIMEKLNTSADAFIAKNLKILYGIVSSESNYEKLSEFVLQQEPLINYGYYEDEIILIKKFGAFISSEESDTIVDVIRLSLVQWWVLKTFDYILEMELDEAQKHIANVPSGYKILSTFTQYNKFSKDSLDFNRDKLEIISSIHTSITEIENDWHLKTLYTNINKIFDTDELYKWVETKITRIEDSYENAKDFLSTNFFILLDIIFFLSLAWSIFDTWLLWKISAK